MHDHIPPERTEEFIAAERRFHRVLIAAGVFVVFSIGAIIFAQVTGFGTMHGQAGTVEETRVLRFADRADGAVLIYDETEGRQVDELAPATNGFLRVVLRGFARDRQQRQIGPEVPFQLRRWSDGHLTLNDPGTQREVDLSVFGPTNRDAFSRLLTVGKTPQ